MPLGVGSPPERVPLPAALPDPGCDGCEDTVPERPSPLRPESLVQRLPATELSKPITLTVLPHTFTGVCTGSCTRFPDSSPGERSAVPPASASA